MQFPPLRFTIRQLICVIAICAVACALLRTPFGLLVVAIASVLPGFLIERARGGFGILGGALSACLIASALVIAGSFLLFPFGLERVSSLLNFFALLHFVSLFAFLLGWILSCILYAILKLPRAMLKHPLLNGSFGSNHSRRLPDRKPEGR